MLTNQDINKLRNLFATKEEVKEIKSNFNKFKIELIEIVTNFKDVILKEILRLREDITITTGYRELIEDHEVRITKLESKQIIPS